MQSIIEEPTDDQTEDEISIRFIIHSADDLNKYKKQDYVVIAPIWDSNDINQIANFIRNSKNITNLHISGSRAPILDETMKTLLEAVADNSNIVIFKLLIESVPAAFDETYLQTFIKTMRHIRIFRLVVSDITNQTYKIIIDALKENTSITFFEIDILENILDVSDFINKVQDLLIDVLKTNITIRNINISALGAGGDVELSQELRKLINKNLEKHNNVKKLRQENRLILSAIKKSTIKIPLDVISNQLAPFLKKIKM